MQNKVIKFAGVIVFFALIIALAIACKVEAAAASDDTSGGGGTAPITVTVDGGISYTVASDGTADVPDPTLAGYDFLGWSTSKDGTSVNFVRNSTKVTTSITIYPIWDTALSSKITFTKDFTTFHAFQYQITIDSLKADTNLEFIASSSATDPGYNNIKNDGAKRSAYFTPTFLKRGVYFSFKNGGDYDGNKNPVLTPTGDFDPTTKNYIDLKAKTGQTQVQSAIEAISPALLSPGGTYYIHVYRNGTHVTSSLAITLPYYPTTWPTPLAAGVLDSSVTPPQYAFPSYNVNNYLLDRSDFHYSTTTDKSTNTTIEVNKDDIIVFGLGAVFPVLNPNSYCGTAPSSSIFYNTTSILSMAYPNKVNIFSELIGLPISPPTSFGNNYTNNGKTDQYYVYDNLYIAPIKSAHNGVQFYFAIKCYGVNSVANDIQNATIVNMKVYDK